MKILITGGAGFIGSELVEYFSKTKDTKIVIIDNFLTKPKEKFTRFENYENVTLYNLSCQSCNEISNEILDCERVFHFAANPDIRKANDDPDYDFNNNVLATYNLLKCLSKSEKLKKFVFASSSVIYGEPDLIPTPENYGALKPISFYGASKLACEGLISAFSHTSGFESVIFRFANVIGPTSTHGVIYDFINKLRKNPNELEILGDGTQNKSYLYISDCVSGIVKGTENSKNTVEIINIGTHQQTPVIEIAKIIVELMNLQNVDFKFDNPLKDGRGWKGDVKTMKLDCSKLMSRGWNPEYTSDESVKITTEKLLENH